MLPTSLLRALRVSAILAAGLLSAGAALAQAVTMVPGTGVGLVPPKALPLSKSFSGFGDQALASSILIVEFPAEAYAQILPSFTPEGMKATGVEATGPAVDWRIAGGQGGRLIRGKQTAGGLVLRKWIVLAKGPGSTVMVTAQSPEDKASALPDAAIEAALKTIALKAPPAMSEQIAALPFAVGDLGGFRPVRVLSGSALLLTEGPRDTIPDASQPVVIVASGVGGGEHGDQASRSSFAREAMATVAGVSDLIVDDDTSFEKDGASWSRLAGFGTYRASSEAIWVVQVVRFAPGGYIRTVAITRAHDKDRLADRIDAVAGSVKPK
ncbi:hypothetical protein [Enterovirga rhinocerotis]|nr:hypothetical protein [Enterovirga rhinocerotis]